MDHCATNRSSGQLAAVPASREQRSPGAGWIVLLQLSQLAVSAYSCGLMTRAKPSRSGRSRAINIAMER